MRCFRTVRKMVLALLIFAVPAACFAGVFVNISIAPPVLPVYVQPPCPEPGYIWTPGYWAYGPVGYYWVPGTWVMAPAPGLLWTPGYWAFTGGYYAWHRGYWGPHVGFYGGVNYGYGYPGAGFYGGRWIGNRYSYNTAVVNVNRTVIHNTYIDRTVIHNNTRITRVSYNGPGGVDARPTRDQRQAYQQRRFEATSEQVQHREQASRNRGNFSSENHGRPSNAAMARPAREGFNGNENHAQARQDFNRPENARQARAEGNRQMQARQDRTAARQQRQNERNERRSEKREDGSRQFRFR